MENITMKILVKIFILFVLFYATSCSPQEFDQNYLGVETPNFFSQDPSPLRSRENLRQPAYFDFLNTLYRHDKSKADLFQVDSKQQDQYTSNTFNARNKRAVIFRPFFVYRQQQIRRNNNVKKY